MNTWLTFEEWCWPAVYRGSSRFDRTWSHQGCTWWAVPLGAGQSGIGRHSAGYITSLLIDWRHYKKETIRVDYVYNISSIVLCESKRVTNQQYNTRRGVSDAMDEVDRFKLLLLVPKLDDLVLLAPIGRLVMVELIDDFRLADGSGSALFSSRLLRNGRQFISDEV